MATAVVAMPNPRSPGGPLPAGANAPTTASANTATSTTTSTNTTTTTTSTTPPSAFLTSAKREMPDVRPPSPSAPLFAAALAASVPPAYERRTSDESDRPDGSRSQSTPTPIARPHSPLPKRTNSTGALPPFLAHGAVLSPPSFHQSLSSNVSPESRRTRSSENIPTVGSSPESSPQQQHANLAGGNVYSPHSMTVRSSDHGLYSGTDYDAMMRPKKRHKTSRACDECRRKKVRLLTSETYLSDPMRRHVRSQCGAVLVV